MTVLPAWRIYYDDGTTYTGPPELAPKLGVQVIAQVDHDHGRHLLHDPTLGYWWWIGDRWYIGDVFGLWDHLAQPGFKIVLFGRSIERERHQAILHLAANDPDLPACPKTGWQPAERRGL